MLYAITVILWNNNHVHHKNRLATDMQYTMLQGPNNLPVIGIEWYPCLAELTIYSTVMIYKMAVLITNTP